MIQLLSDVINHSFDLGQNILSKRSVTERKQNGQFLTPPILRALPLPPWELIGQIGNKMLSLNGDQLTVDLETIILTALQEAGWVSKDLPIIRDTRLMVGKIQEAQEILKTLGLPTAQQNEMSALTLLVLAQLSEETPWSEAKLSNLRIHDIVQEVKARYNREYAENTRETIRRQVIHQFEQAGLVIRNPDDPKLPTNSPRTHYALSDVALRIIHTYGSGAWEGEVRALRQAQHFFTLEIQKIKSSCLRQKVLRI